AENHHVHLFRPLYGRGDTLEILNRPQTNKEVEKLPQRDVQRTNPAADRCGQRALDSNQKLAERFDGVVWEPAIEFVFRGLTGKDFKPGDFLFAPVSFLCCRIEDPHACRPNIRPGPIAANEWNNWTIGNV